MLGKDKGGRGVVLERLGNSKENLEEEKRIYTKSFSLRAATMPFVVVPNDQSAALYQDKLFVGASIHKFQSLPY